MTLDEAKAMAFNAAQERLLNPYYHPTKDKLAAIDMVLIEQKRKREADTENKHATLT
ncbi:hypothetical protein [Propionivibrio sp.]|uniref:hypothetical protein n=1 Tax=Propionivibrio sp. TaxID=2212460 RepID=UPI003BF332F4